jgi:hypothetical protein
MRFVSTVAEIYRSARMAANSALASRFCIRSAIESACPLKAGMSSLGAMKSALK